MDKNFKRSLFYMIPLMPICIGGLGVVDHIVPFEFMNGPFGLKTSIGLIIFGVVLTVITGLLENRFN